MQSRTLTPVHVPAVGLSRSVADRLWFWSGFVFTLGLPFGALILIGDRAPLAVIEEAWVMLLGAVAAFLTTALLLDRTLRYPGSRSSLVTIPMSLLPILVMIAFIALTRVYYSRVYLLIFAACLVLWSFTRYRVQRRPHARTLALLPFGDMSMLDGVAGVRFFTLQKPRMPETALDGIVVDMHAEIPADWVKFLADAVMRQIRIYHAASLLESLAGRVWLAHFAALHIEDMRPPPWFNPIKRAIDLGVVILIAPFAIPIGLFVAIAIRLESRGPALYRQIRTGARGTSFTMLKFRSMRQDAEAHGAQFTTENDPRITRLGQFLRKTRLDELPQLWNILKGEMSLVGPRPERPKFVAEYDKSIPHYELRHLVRPGLTGWAQIETGYSSDREGTVRKLERDFYYIKYRSLALDIFIIYRTLRTVCFGSGAR